MKIEDFWNQAFLAALGRLPAQEAKAEADLATDLCVAHWQANRSNWAPQSLPRWQEQDIFHVPALGHRFSRQTATQAFQDDEPAQLSDAP